MWYSFDPERPVQVSFFLDVERGSRWHETELAGQTDELANLFPYYRPGGGDGSVLVDGAVSVVYNGEELLGGDYWVEFVVLASVWSVLCGDGVSTWVLNAGRQRLRLSEDGGDMLFEVSARSKVVRRRRLPLGPFVREWFLMRARVNRVRLALGDRSLGPFATDPLHGCCDRLVDLVGRDLAARTATLSLDELLSDPIPSGPRK